MLTAFLMFSTLQAAAKTWENLTTEERIAAIEDFKKAQAVDPTDAYEKLAKLTPESTTEDFNEAVASAKEHTIQSGAPADEPQGDFAKELVGGIEKGEE